MGFVLAGNRIKIKTKRTAAGKFTKAYNDIKNQYYIIILDYDRHNRYISMLKPGSMHHSKKRFIFVSKKNNYLYMLKHGNKMVYDINDGIVKLYIR